MSLGFLANSCGVIGVYRAAQQQNPAQIHFFKNAKAGHDTSQGTAGGETCALELPSTNETDPFCTRKRSNAQHD